MFQLVGSETKKGEDKREAKVEGRMEVDQGSSGWMESIG